MNRYSFEKVGGNVNICVSPEHTFGTDAFLLSYFARPKKKDRAVDLGTGCGIIPLLWMRDENLRPQQVHGVDIQPQAIEQMEITKKHSDNLENFHPLLCDLREIRQCFDAGETDLVTCNPPYNVPGAGLMSETSSDQIARHETLCTTDDVSTAAAWLLRFGGRLCLCQLPERLTDVMTSLREHQIEPKRLRMVQQFSHSTPWLILVEGKRGAKPGLIIESPLIMKKDDGSMSDEMEIIYGMYGKV